jgi:hypothetical protein
LADPTRIISDLYQIATKPEHLAVAFKYLQSRGLDRFADVGYVKVFPWTVDTLIVESLVFFYRDIIGNITMIETRSLKHHEYKKVWKQHDSIPVWNLAKVGAYQTVILTEAIFECETVNQCCGGAIAISAGSASLTANAKMFLGCLLYGRAVYIAFNNDDPGSKASRDLLKQYQERWRIELNILDFPYPDLNECLMKKGKSFLRKHIAEQIAFTNQSLSEID